MTARDDFEVEDAPDTGADTKGKDAAAEVGYARYRHLKANVRKRRAAYKVFIPVAIVVFAATIADILFLKSVLEIPLLVAFGILLIVAIALLFSSRRGREELAEIDRLQRTLLQCPDCKNVFQYGEIHFDDHKKAAFSCPICGAYGALPDNDADPVKAVVPEGELKVRHYVCGNCREEIEVGTYGDQPLYDVRFRTCPHCGESKFIQKKPARPVEPVNPV